MPARKGDGPGSPGPAKHNRFRDDWSIEEKPPGNALIEEFLYAYEVMEEDDAWLLEVLPEVVKCFQRYQRHEAKTLDEAFGAERPTKYRHGPARNRARNRGRVRNLGRSFFNAGAVIDDAFFEVLGEICQVSGGTARAWYYEQPVLPRPGSFSKLHPALEPYRDRMSWLDR